MGNSDEALIEWLKDCAVCVCGNWVLKSEKAGFEIGAARTRDVPLALFHRKRGRVSSTEMRQWSEHFKQWMFAQQNILKELARLQKIPSEVWVFRFQPDNEFFARKPHLINE